MLASKVRFSLLLFVAMVAAGCVQGPSARASAPLVVETDGNDVALVFILRFWNGNSFPGPLGVERVALRINDRAVEAPYDYHTPLEIEKRAHLSAAVTVRVDDAIAVGQLLDDDPRPDKIDWTADITFTDYYVGVFKSPVVHWAKVRYRGEPVGVGTHQLQLHRADAAAETSHPAPD